MNSVCGVVVKFKEMVDFLKSFLQSSSEHEGRG